MAYTVDNHCQRETPTAINAEKVVTLRRSMPKGDPKGVSRRTAGLLHRHRNRYITEESSYNKYLSLGSQNKPGCALLIVIFATLILWRRLSGEVGARQIYA